MNKVHISKLGVRKTVVHTLLWAMAAQMTTQTQYWARTHDMPAMIRCLDHWSTAAPTSHYKATRGLIVMDLRILSLGQVPRLTLEGNAEVNTLSKLQHYSNWKALSLYRFRMHQPHYKPALQCHKGSNSCYADHEFMTILAKLP
ncbi:hypothetical protein TNCV_3209301 [Trichonephila clavipes]|nr:hypothetical protein TNCV_3209301 [Trichonephila clavipes]